MSGGKGLARKGQVEKAERADHIIDIIEEDLVIGKDLKG